MNDEQLRQEEITAKTQDLSAEQDNGLNGNSAGGTTESGQADEGRVEASIGNAGTGTTANGGNGDNDMARPEMMSPSGEATEGQAPDPATQDATGDLPSASSLGTQQDENATMASPEVSTMASSAMSVEEQDVTASQPASMTSGEDQPVFTDAVEVPTMAAQPSTSVEAGAATEESVTRDAGIDEPGAVDEAPVVRVIRDTRLNEMAPNASMEDLLKASEQQYRTLKHGDVIEGTVMKVDRDEILVDIGSKSEGIVPSHELQSLSAEERETMKIGDGLLVSVVQPENNEGHAILSLDRARQEKSWRDLQKTFEDAEVIQAEVSGYNKGGLLVNLGGVRGFVPSSQVSQLSGVEANKQSEMSKLQGQKLSLKIIEINRSRNRLILSERQAAQEQRESMRSRLLKELEPGQVRPGTVSSICDFGAFVDIGGADGLIHLSELSWKRVSHPSEVLKVQDRIDVFVLSVDPNERKIALSLKRTQPEPWSTITDNYHLGQVVRGTITQLTSFGAFARLEDGIEGLIHVSELAEGRVAHPRNVVKEGDVVELKVIRIDPVKKRIGLSLKRMNEDAEGGAEAGSDAATGVVDEETAAGAAETPGAYGLADEPSVAQENLMPVVEQNLETPAPGQQQQTSRREQQFQSQPQQQRGNQQQGRRHEQRQQPQPQARVPVEEEPMGAMAHAFAMRAQSQQSATQQEADGEETAPTPTAQVAPEEQATAQVATSTDAPAEVEAQAEAESETTEEAGTREPEAMMPSATDIEESLPDTDATASDESEAVAEDVEADAPASEPVAETSEESESEEADSSTDASDTIESMPDDAASEVLTDATPDEESSETDVETGADSTGDAGETEATVGEDSETAESDDNKTSELPG